MTGPTFDERKAGIDAEDKAKAEREAARFANTLMSRSQLRNLPAVESLIDDILSLRASAVLVGATGAGKTFLALSWACCVGTGHAWLGHGVERAPVLYVVGEGAYGLNDRVEAWETAWNTKVGDGDVIFSVKPASLKGIDVWIEMRDEARRLGCKLIILDTFSSLAPDADETKDAASLTRRMSDLAASINGTVLLVHHPGWGDAERTRGGYQLEANVDEVLLLRGNAKDPLIQLERKKVKEGPAGTNMWLRRRPMHGSIIIESARAEDAMAPVADRILIVLADLDQASGPQLQKELGIEHRSTLSRALKKLIDDNKVAEHGSGTRKTYTLASQA